jgi:hypothetical protein
MSSFTLKTRPQSGNLKGRPFMQKSKDAMSFLKGRDSSVVVFLSSKSSLHYNIFVCNFQNTWYPIEAKISDFFFFTKQIVNGSMLNEEQPPSQ